MTAIMRTLGYPRIITMDNFRTPNFELVADMLYWMAERYDPENAAIHPHIESEQDRVEFIVGMCKEIYRRSSIQLNPKRLYSADGYAVKELLKLAMVLFKARQLAMDSTRDDDTAEQPSSSSTLSAAAEAKSLATEIIDVGAKLHDLLQAELESHPKRIEAMKFLDAMCGNLEKGQEHEHVETSILRSINTAKEDMEKLSRKCEDLVVEEKQLDDAIRRKERDLERNQQRLESLNTIRPAFMNEYDQLELEFQRQYETYIERYRNVDYLEHEMEVHDAAEKDILQYRNQMLQRMQKKYQDEELRLLLGEEDPLNRKDFANRREPRADR